MKILISLLLLGACSTRQLSLSEREKGSHLFNQKLKLAYTKFFQHSVFPSGKRAYAGPAFLPFVNGQPLSLETLVPMDAKTASFQAEDGSRLEYLQHDLRKGSDGLYRLKFSGMFRSLEEAHKLEFDLTLELKCRDQVECTYDQEADMLTNVDPYEFLFRFNQDYLRPSATDYAQFTDAEVTGIKQRYIFRGMSQKAVELAIGTTTQYLHGFFNLKYENNFIKTFEFRYNDALPLFSRY